MFISLQKCVLDTIYLLVITRRIAFAIKMPKSWGRTRYSRFVEERNGRTLFLGIKANMEKISNERLGTILLTWPKDFLIKNWVEYI